MAVRDEIDIRLTADEALVLFEWLSQFNRQNDVVFDGTAERRVLFDLESKLEASLPVLFEPKYEELLTGARTRLRDESKLR